MKICLQLLLLAFFACQSGTLANNCSPFCRDLTPQPLICVLARNRCHQSLFSAFCMETCGLCRRCDSEPVIVGNQDERSMGPNGCEIETCVDVAPPDQCYSISMFIPDGCRIYPQSCRLSCGQCTPCPIPDAVPTCSTDCHDMDTSCEHWRDLGYCNTSSQFSQFTRATCKSACEICFSCPTPEPLNTQLPPLPEACSTNCVDTNEACEHFREQGYCDKLDEFPLLEEVCRFSCDICTPCPTEPPTSQCMIDCEDFNKECEFWESQGYCDVDQGFPRVLEECPLSCGVCSPCDETKDLSRALPPTRMELENQFL